MLSGIQALRGVTRFWLDTSRRSLLLLLALALGLASLSEPTALAADQNWTATWTRRSDSPAGPRGWIDVAFDSVNGRAVLFGGSGGPSGNDLWQYAPGTDVWTQLESNTRCPASFSPPTGREEYALEYDPVNQLFWIFGGDGYGCVGSAHTAGSGTTTVAIVDPTLTATTVDFYKDWIVNINDQGAWVTAYNPTTKRLTLAWPLAASQPGAKYFLYPQPGGGTFSYSPATRTWGSVTGPHWKYTGPEPLSRLSPAMAYSTRSAALVMFGGQGWTDTWKLDSATKSWVQMIPYGTPGSPPGMAQLTNSMVYDSDNDVFILFGGCLCTGDTGPASGDTWAYQLSTNTWRKLTPAGSPPPRQGHNLVYDSTNKAVVLFGGIDPQRGTFYSDLWVYRYATNSWTQVFPAASPPGRNTGAMVYDPVSQRAIVYGGRSPGSPLQDVWALQLQGPPPGNPAPTLTSLPSNTALAGGPAFTLAVTGANFTASSTVRWKGADRPTTFVRNTQLQASISAADIANPGTAQVSVNTPAPGGGLSNALTFTVTAPVPAPTLTSISPATAAAGSGPVSLTATGSNFMANSVVRINGSARATAFVSATVMTATLLAGDLATAGTLSIDVFTPAPGGGSSASRTFTVAAINPTPTISSLNPSSVGAGSTGLALTVTGTGFVTGTSATVGGQARAAAFVSSTQLTIAAQSADVAGAGTVPVQVTNPAVCAAGICTSNSVDLSVTSVSTPTPVSASTLPVTGQFLGVTGQDKVGQNNQTTPNGVQDWHFRLSNVQSDPSSVQINNFTNGVGVGQWNVPYAPGHWIIAKSFAAGVLDLWVEPYFGGLYGEPTIVPGLFTITLTYADGTIARVTGIPSGLTAAPSSTPSAGTSSTPSPAPAQVSPPVTTQASSTTDPAAIGPGQWALLPGSVGQVQWRDPQTGKTIDQFPGSYNGPGLLGGATYWVGGILDERRGHYVALNWGGHDTTPDNSVLAFDILGKGAPSGDAAPAQSGGPRAWNRWTDPTPSSMQAPPLQDSPDFFPDGKPTTTHSYGGVQHMLGANGEIDRYWFTGGNKFISGATFQSTGEYDPKTKTWRQTDARIWGNKLSSAWDPSRLRVLLRDYMDLWQYDPQAAPGSKYTQLTNDQLPKAPEDYAGSAIFDKQRNRYLEAGIFANYGVGIRYYVLDPKTGAPVRDPSTGLFMRVAPINLSVFPDLSPDTFWRSPSFIYDEISHDYVLHMGLPINGGGNSSNLLFRVNPDTWAVTVEKSTNSPTNSVRTGMYSKMRHLVSADLYVQVVDSSEGVWLYRPTRAGVAPAAATVVTPAATTAPALQAATSPAPTAQASTTTSTPTGPVTGQFLGVTGEDKVGQNNQTTPNGVQDWHFRLSNVQSDPSSVQINNFTNGLGVGQWNVPYAPDHWIIAKSFAAGVLDLWAEPYFGGLNGDPTIVPGLFTITLTHADGTTARVTGIASGLTAAPPSPAPAAAATSPTPSAAATPSPGTAAVAAGQALPLRQWVERPNPYEGQAYMAGRGGKHGRAFYHPGLKSMVFAGGDWHTSMPQYDGLADGTGSEIWGLNALNNQWTLLRPLCVPGAVQPGRPDTVTWAYDSKRNQGLMAPGFYFITQAGGKPDCGEQNGWGGYAFSFASRTYTGPDAAAGLPAPPAGWGGDTGASYGVYDPVADELIRLRNAPTMERLNLGTKTWRVQTLVKPGSPGWNPIPNRAQPAIDVAGRALYFIDAWNGAPNVVRINLNDGSLTTIPLPAGYKPPAAPDHEIYLAFDPANRVLFVPNNADMGQSPLTGLGIYHVDTGQWEWESVPAAAFGSVWGFDENVGALIGIGKRVSPSAYYLYKYK